MTLRIPAPRIIEQDRQTWTFKDMRNITGTTKVNSYNRRDNAFYFVTV